METTLFYVLGIALVLAALGVTALGLRSDSFPSRAVLAVGTALFAGLVLATAAFAVLTARDEQEHREEELAAQEAEAEEQVAQAEPGTAAQPEGNGEPTTVDITSLEDGSLSFEPDGLEAPAGSVTIAYDNPSPVPHNVAIEAPDGAVLNESETAPDSLLEATAELQPGEYVFFCTVPGHREGGMEGNLIVE
jgi:plastocyanin